MTRWLIAIFLAVLEVHATAAPLKLAFVFGDSMVLQRSVPVPIWGTADAEANVTVNFAGQSHSTKADANGKWMIRLDPMPASTEPRELRVVSGTTIDLSDVSVGEVWVAAGQSNMEFPLSRELHAADEIPEANRPMVRLLNLSFAGQYVYGKQFSPDIINRLNPDSFYAGIWAHCTPKSAKPFSAIGYYFARDLQAKLGVPVGMINLAVGGSPTEAWIRRQAMAGEPLLASLVSGSWLSNPSLDAWCKQRGRENLGPYPATDDPGGPNHPFKPGFLWEAGIARLIPFPIRGVLWYQGESNSLTQARMIQHESLFHILVNDWRKSWGIGDFPFLYCQLSGIETANYKSQYWPEFRDQQRRMLSKIPCSAMAVTSDYGNRSDVHPLEKREISRRLVASAMSVAYGSKGEWQGPLADALILNGNELSVSFTHTTGGLLTSDLKPMRGFEIAGSDGTFHAADAVSVGATIRLTSPLVRAPVSARYDWQPFPDGNVINGAQFPCSTFTLTLQEGRHDR